ncbi:hypothetical protein KM914_07570 [Virgibacillus pantothenticus]|nr:MULTISPECIES: hypothetical protein [Virgibacillus]MBS7430153.1 hypothetical protein [Virgibacillus sp. 19R1-5]MBU8566289.1 hypothetical protein [Virgibacillus pantothenticus]MBU8640819.1 hypothetical protein [Virgibacillus pantothenticus]MBU8646426.1 hypothetical protein [Virgibacillus pantothenticus]MBU8660170.1 hypothetical protein [Virgibacillus pantothenticus]
MYSTLGLETIDFSKISVTKAACVYALTISVSFDKLKGAENGEEPQ